MTDDVWSLPGPARRAAATGSALLGGASCAIVAPSALRGNDEWLAAAIEATGAYVDLVPVDPTRPPAAVVADHFGTDWAPGPGAVHALARSDPFAGRIVGLTLPAANSDWAHFAADFLAALPAVTDTSSRPQLLVFCGPDELAIFRSQRLPVTEMWWWGTIGRLDTIVAATRLLGETADPVLVSCITEVCGYDIRFAATLAQQWDGSLNCLLDLVADQPGPAATVDERSTLAGRGGSVSPPARFREDWDRGLIDAWERYEPFIAPTALPGDVRADVLRTRLWRGQLRELMPLVDEERARLETWMRGGPIAQKNVTFPIEIGSLTHLLHTDPAVRPRTTATRRQAAAWLQTARNALAHRDIVTPADIADGLALLDRDRRQGVS